MDKLFGKKEEGPQFVDFRSAADRQRQEEAALGISLGSEIDGLVEELLEIDRTDGFMSDPRTRSGKYDDRGRHLRTREIGETLNSKGGYPLMAKVAYRVQSRGGNLRYLEVCWGDIGRWMA
jgi:hypothetical protein